MRDYSELKGLAIAAQNDNGDYVALNDYGMAVPPAVVLSLIEEYERVCALNHAQFGDAIRGNAERDRLKVENERLRAGMKGDFDLDAWLGWAQEAEALRAKTETYCTYGDEGIEHTFYGDQAAIKALGEMIFELEALREGVAHD